MSGYGEDASASREGVVPDKRELLKLRMTKNNFGTQHLETVKEKSDGQYVPNRNKIQSVLILEPSTKLRKCSDDRTKEQHNIICWERNRRSDCVEAQADSTDSEVYGAQQLETVRETSEGMYVLNRNKIQFVICLEPSTKQRECSDDRTKKQHFLICWEQNRRSACMEAQADVTASEVVENPDYRSNNLKVVKNQENSSHDSGTGL